MDLMKYEDLPWINEDLKKKYEISKDEQKNRGLDN